MSQTIQPFGEKISSHVNRLHKLLLNKTLKVAFLDLSVTQKYCNEGFFKKEKSLKKWRTEEL